MKKIELSLIIFISLNNLSTFSQTHPDSINRQGTETIIELKKAKSGAMPIHFREGKRIWVHFTDASGTVVQKKARITNIADHKITFKPIDSNLHEVGAFNV